MVGLTAAGRRRFRGYSLGMRQRLGMAAALLGDPQVLILDEPANGLDPEGIRWMRGAAAGAGRGGRTILLSSHLLAEMEQLADDLIIIAAGRLVAQGTVASIIGSMTQASRTLVRTPRAGRTRSRARRRGRRDAGRRGDVYITGVGAVAIGDAAQRAGIAIHQLATAAPGPRGGVPGTDRGKGRDPMTARSPRPGRARASGTRSLRLVRAEIMKIRTTRTWWLFLVGFTLFTAAALTSNGFSHHYQLYPQQDISGHGRRHWPRPPRPARPRAWRRSPPA